MQRDPHLAGEPVPPGARPALRPADRSRCPAEPRLSVPPLPPRHISRPRLLDALDTAVAAAALTLVTAAPGGGKTVLLSEWARRRPAPTAWLALTRADDDPARFWCLFARAARAAAADRLPQTVPRGTAPGLLDALFGDEPAGAAPVVVVLDDADVLTHPDVTEGLDRVVRRWPHRVRLVLGTRGVPRLPLHRYRVAGALRELHGGDLAMSPPEMAQLLHAHGITLNGPDALRLARRTEGWPAGVRLAALHLEGAEQPVDVVRQLAMNEGSVGEYLTKEVLSVVPEPVQQLLVQTSFLDEVTGGTAEAVTGLAGCEAILADLARRNSFVVPLDDTFTTFRYHPLFREVLQYLARRDGGPSAAQAHRRVSAWCSSQGDVHGAIRWALAGGDVARARSVLVRGGLARAVLDGRDLGDLPLDDLLRSTGGDGAEAEVAVARLAVAAIAATNGSSPAVVPGADLREPHDPALRLTQRLAVLQLTVAAGAHEDVDRCVARLTGDDVRLALDEVPGLRGFALLLRAGARFAAGRLDDVLPGLDQALTEARREQAWSVCLDTVSLQAMASASAGRMRHADEALARAGDLLAAHPEVAVPVLLDLAVARAAYVRAHLAEMARVLQRAGEPGRYPADARAAATIAFLNGVLLAASGRPDEARSWLVSPALEAGGAGLLRVHRDCELAALDTAQGRPRSALARLAPHLTGRFAPTAAVPAANARLVLGEVDAAARLVGPVVTDPSPQVDRYLLVTALLCKARIATDGGDDAAALDHLDRAVRLADPDVCMPFVREADAFARLLRRHPDAARAWPSHAHALGVAADALPPAAPAPRGARTAVLPQPLTERETAVLRLLTTSMSTTELADELVLSVNTVKTHLAAIYRKLGVGRRREAVHRARELEML